MRNVIVKNIARADAATIGLLGQLGVATVDEAQGRTGLMHPSLRPIYPSARAAGSAVTVSCQAGDNLMVHAAMDVVQPGDMLVVTTRSPSTDGMFGDLLAESCRAHGVAGLIVDAGVRDVAEISAMNFPVWSKAICAQGSVKATAGSVNIDVVCAGALVHPGDVIVADQDGVVVIPRESAQEIAQLGEARRQREERSRERLRAGELGLDMHGLRKLLSDLGVEWVEGSSE